MSDPGSPPPGWYPESEGVLRWWDGVQWTSQLAYRSMSVRAPKKSRGQVMGTALLIAPLLVLSLAGLAVMGHNYPTARVGVAKEGERVRLVMVGCEGEHLTSVVVRRVIGSEASASDPVVWRVEGNGPVPEAILVGVTPIGLAETVPFDAAITESDRLSVRVGTDQLEPAWPLVFSMAQLPATGYLSESGVSANQAELRSALLSGTSCDDPYGDKSKSTILNWALVVMGALLVSGLIVLLVARRSRRV
jgi:hypothetical protein